jgi:hypothetical protein
MRRIQRVRILEALLRTNIAGGWLGSSTASPQNRKICGVVALHHSHPITARQAELGGRCVPKPELGNELSDSNFIMTLQLCVFASKPKRMKTSTHSEDTLDD